MRRSLIPGWFLAMVVASIVITVTGTFRELEQPRVQNKELYDCLWIDSWPQKRTDSWNGYLFRSGRQGAISVQAASAYKRTLEIFELKLDGSTMSFHFPHDGRRSTCTFTIEKLKKPTRQFDTQLTLSADPQKGGKSSVYFTGPELRSVGNVQAALDSLGLHSSR